MIYKCENPECGFLFSREGEVSACPVCGKPNILPANPYEVERFLRMMEEENNK